MGQCSCHAAARGPPGARAMAAPHWHQRTRPMRIACCLVVPLEDTAAGAGSAAVQYNQCLGQLGAVDTALCCMARQAPQGHTAARSCCISSSALAEPACAAQHKRSCAAAQPGRRAPAAPAVPGRDGAQDAGHLLAQRAAGQLRGPRRLRAHLGRCSGGPRGCLPAA